MADQIRIAVVDDHPLFRDSVVLLVKTAADMTVVATGASAAEAVEIAKKHAPDIMLLDVNMPGNGIEAVQAITTGTPSVRSIMLTVSEVGDDIVAALEGGARGYVLKDVTGPELLKTIRSVQAGEPYLSPNLAVRVLARMRQTASRDTGNDVLARLTPREEEVLRQAATGMSNKEIAQNLELSDRTVKQHMTNILHKLRVRNRVEAAALFHKPE